MKITAQQIVAALAEELAAPFAKSKVILQYRPFQLQGGWRWYWVRAAAP